MNKPGIKPEQGKRLKKCLKYRNVTQAWLSENAHISQPTISDIVRGKVRLTEQNAILFARVLDVNKDYLLLETDYITQEEKASERWKNHNERERLYLQILELNGFRLIETISELAEVTNDSFFINQWKLDSDTITLHHVNHDRARIIFLYNSKIKKLSPPVLLADFLDMINSIDYHFLCELEKPFRKYKEMMEFAIPIKKAPST